MTSDTKKPEKPSMTAFLLGLGGLGLIGFLAVLHGVFQTEQKLQVAAQSYQDPSVLSVATWNVAAINNNPFEYWITHHDASYNELMNDVQRFIDEPGSRDVKVSSVFTQAMFDDLKASMERVGWDGCDAVEEIWRTDYSDRRIISGFVKDGTLGKKRLASMPDRVTNTINAFTEAGEAATVFRPTVINCYEGPLGSGDEWWRAWKTFVFETRVNVNNDGDHTPVYEMFNPIKRSKYPALSEEEERISIPLQTLAGAIFDAVLVHMMNEIAPSHWQTLRGDMCDQLNRKKDHRTTQILESSYDDVDVVFLQEAASTFVAKAQASTLGTKYHVFAPAAMDPNRDQNSLVLLKKKRFPDPTSVSELSDRVVATMPPGTAAAGDLLAISAFDAYNHPFVFASFHGDTNGLATIPVTTALHEYLQLNGLTHHKLLFGLDANTYKAQRDGYQNVLDYQKDILSKGMASHRGATQHIDASDYTTFNARTYLQPQLNKAVSFADRYTNLNVDHNPKDFILFYAAQCELVDAAKDNTGRREYTEDMMFPTLDFPSDHGITSAHLKLTR